MQCLPKVYRYGHIYMAQHYTILFHSILDLSMIIPLQGYMLMWVSYSCYVILQS